jgi:hypothetical protein
MFSDESLIKQFYSFSSHVRRPIGQRYNRRYTLPRVKHSPLVMVWGSMSYAGAGPLHFVPQGSTINADVYLKILQNHLFTSMADHSCTRFQHDGAPAHNSRVVKTGCTTMVCQC